MKHREAIIDFVHSTIDADFDAGRDALRPLLDSVALVQLVTFLEEKFHVVLDVAEVGLEPFETVESLAAAVESSGGREIEAEETVAVATLSATPDGVCDISDELLEAGRQLWEDYVDAMREYDSEVAYNEHSFDLIIRGMRGAGAAHGRFLVQCSGSELLGFIVARIRMTPPYMGAEREGFIADMYVHPDYRRSGVASQLHEGALQFFREAGVETVALTVLQRNEKAHRFWERLGYQDYLQEMKMKL